MLGRFSRAFPRPPPAWRPRRAGEIKVIGRATGGGYGFRLNKSLALVMVRPELAAVGAGLMIDILDQRLRATILEESPYDPDNQRLRA